MEVGDKIRFKGFAGGIVGIWDGIYESPFFNGKQYNPYRITVKMCQEYIDKFGVGLCANGTITVLAEALSGER